MSHLGRRRFLLWSGVAGVALLGGGITWRNRLSVDGRLVTDPAGTHFAYAEGWIVELGG